jgi:FHA domain
VKSSGAPHPVTGRELQEVQRLEQASRAFLLCRNADDEQLIRVLEPGDEVVPIGRRAGGGLVIDWDPEVSRVHAELRDVGGEWVISDDGLSRNGTVLNGERLAGQRRLRDGDTIRVGDTAIAFHDPGSGGGGSETQRGRPEQIPELTATQQRVLLELCRPAAGPGFAAAPSNQAIADAVALSVDAVKAHLGALFAKFGLAHLPQNQKRAALIERALSLGVVTEADLRS